MNQPLNRAQRRAMARGKLPAGERFAPLPALLDEFTIFDMPQTILDKLRNGEIEAERRFEGREAVPLENTVRGENTGKDEQ
jgi:hypothetical protein